MDALKQLDQYLLKYKTRLNAKNTMNIKQIIYILNELLKHFNNNSQNNNSNVFERVDFLIKLGIENLNLYKILDYCQKSRIARKLFGFNQKQNQTKDQNKTEINKKPMNGTTAFLTKMKLKNIEIKTIDSNSTSVEEEIRTYGSPLYLIQEFLRALINTNTNSKIITNYDKNSIRNSSLKYILLNPGSHFKVIFNIEVIYNNLIEL